MKKRILSVLLALAMLLSLLPAITPTANATEVAAGDCGANGNNVGWCLSDDGTLYIFGEGAMADFDVAPWESYCSSIMYVDISDSVTSISNGAFFGCEALISVTIGTSVASIGDYAFYCCTSLSDVTIPNSVVSIGYSAFAACDNLTNVTIGSSVSAIGEEAFSYCGNLTNITVSSDNSNYANDAQGVLYNKDYTTLVCYPNGKSGNYSIPNSVTSIGNYAFFNCANLTGITIPDSVISIGKGAFAICANLTDISIPDSVTTIGESAFFDCDSLGNVTISDSVTTISDGAFSDCESLTAIDVDANNPNYTSDDNGVLFNKDYTTLLQYPCGKSGSYTIPESVTTISKEAFYFCNGLTSVVISDAVAAIGDYAFCSCSNLTEIYFEGNAPAFAEGVFANCTLTAYYPAEDATWTDGVMQNYDGEVTWIAQEDGGNTEPVSGTCGADGDNLTWTLSDDGTLTISGEGDMADFEWDPTPWSTYSSRITQVLIGDNVTSIGDNAFSNCENLTDVTIGNSVISIDYSAFSYCSNLTEITLPDSVTSIGDFAFYCCSNLTQVTIGNSVTSIGYCAFGNCSSLTEIAIPDSVTSIGGDAFSDCENLTDVTIGNAVTSIDERAFGFCSSLTEITIPDSVTSIGAYAFVSCYGLDRIIFEGNAPEFSDGVFSYISLTAYYPAEDATWTDSVMQNYDGEVTWVALSKACGADGDNLTWTLSEDGTLTISGEGDMADFTYDTIPWYVYSSRITQVIIGDNVTSIGEYAFNGCENLTEIAIPDSVASIGDNAFSNCKNLADVTIGSAVTSIGNSAFSYCSNLTEITIPDSVTSIGDNAFYSCSNLTKIVVAANNPNYASDDGVLFSKDYTTLIRCPSGKTGNYTIPDSVTAISEEAFYFCTGLTGITIPDSVTAICDFTFANCDSLTSINIPDSVTSIGEEGFGGCDSLVNVTIGNAVTSIGPFAFTGCINLTSIQIPDSVVSVGHAAFSNCDNLTDVTIGNSVKTITNGCFMWCTSLKNVTIGNSVTLIDNYAFLGCANLTDIKIPDSVTSIGEHTFGFCTNLTKVTIGDAVTVVGNSFYGCEKLASVSFNGNAPQFSENTFGLCKLTAYYPADDETWTDDIMQNYGGEITWVAHTHSYTETVTTKPTATKEGIKTYTCNCGDSYTESIPASTIPNPFVDVKPGDFYYDAVLWAVDSGITTGTSGNKFSPDATCTRSQIVTFLWRAAGKPAPTNMECNFSDVNSNDYFYQAVLWAVENGITSGTGGSKFSPLAPCNRDQVVTFLWRAAGKPAPTNTDCSFTDVDPQGFYYDAMLWAVENGITSGTGGSKFSPTAPCSRGQIVTFLYRFDNID